MGLPHKNEVLPQQVQTNFWSVQGALLNLCRPNKDKDSTTCPNCMCHQLFLVCFQPWRFYKSSSALGFLGCGIRLSQELYLHRTTYKNWDRPDRQTYIIISILLVCKGPLVQQFWIRIFGLDVLHSLLYNFILSYACSGPVLYPNNVLGYLTTLFQLLGT